MHLFLDFVCLGIGTGAFGDLSRRAHTVVLCCDVLFVPFRDAAVASVCFRDFASSLMCVWRVVIGLTH